MTASYGAGVKLLLTQLLLALNTNTARVNHTHLVFDKLWRSWPPNCHFPFWPTEELSDSSLCAVSKGPSLPRGAPWARCAVLKEGPQLNAHMMKLRYSITRAALRLKLPEGHSTAESISHTLGFPLGTWVTPYLIYHHTVSIDIIATVQHVRKPTSSVELGGLLGFFEDVTGAI